MNHELAKRLTWEIAAINVHIENIQSYFASELGISSPQWLILIALADLDRGDGVSVKIVSKKLHVDPSFVTTQSKMLEKKGFIRRKTSVNDARVVQMSLTDRTYKQMAQLASKQEELDKFIFMEFTESALEEFTRRLTALKKRIEKASLKVANGI
jgi:DNA-binding MarR family transcriptional regulator